MEIGNAYSEYERLRDDWLFSRRYTREHELFIRKGMIEWARLYAEHQPPPYMSSVSSSPTKIISKKEITDTVRNEITNILATIFWKSCGDSGQENDSNIAFYPPEATSSKKLQYLN